MKKIAYLVLFISFIFNFSLFSYKTSDIKLLQWWDSAISHNDQELLKELDLRNLDLKGANLGDLNLRGADLTGSIFRDSTLNNIDFTEASLMGVLFCGATINDCIFKDNNMTLVDFTDTKITPDNDWPGIYSLDKRYLDGEALAAFNSLYSRSLFHVKQYYDQWLKHLVDCEMVWLKSKKNPFIGRLLFSNKFDQLPLIEAEDGYTTESESACGRTLSK